MIYAEVFAIGDTRPIEGPVVLSSARVTRALDGTGSITVELPITAPRASLIEAERVIKVYSERRGVRRLVGSGIVNQIERRVTERGLTLRASGPDLLDMLRRRNTLLGFSLVGPFTDSIQQVLGLANWNAVVTGDWPAVSSSFNAQTIVQTLGSVVSGAGAHYRLSTESNQVEVGSFGDRIGVMAANPAQGGAALADNTTLLLIDTLTQTERSDDVVTWLAPVGGKLGNELTTLQYATIGPVSVDLSTGSPVYYISSPDAIYRYGIIQQVKTFTDIKYSEATPAGREAGSNALYAAAWAYLSRQSEPVQTYKLLCRKADVLVRPGDSLRVVWKGVVNGDLYLDIDDWFYVTKATEYIGFDANLELDISTVDRVLDTPERIVARTIASQRKGEIDNLLG
jgi:hypothetical protein